jgi:hypothetical protein
LWNWGLAFRYLPWVSLSFPPLTLHNPYDHFRGVI